MLHFSQFLFERSEARETFHRNVIALIPHYKQSEPFQHDPHENFIVSHPTIPGVRLMIDHDTEDDHSNASIANVMYNPETHGKIGRKQMGQHILPHVTAWALAVIAKHNELQGPTHKTKFNGASAVHDNIYRHLIPQLRHLPQFKHSYVKEKDNGSFPSFFITGHPQSGKQQ